MIYDSHFKTAGIEKILGDIDNNQVKQVIILSVRNVINHKRKTGSKMTVGDLKRCLQKNLNLKRSQEALLRKGDSFDQTWNIFLNDLREHYNTKHSWYLL